MKNDMTRPRRLLTDRQCRLFLNDMRDFGYEDLTFEAVRRVADELHRGIARAENVIAVMMARQIDDAETELARRWPRGRKTC